MTRSPGRPLPIDSRSRGGPGASSTHARGRGDGERDAPRRRHGTLRLGKVLRRPRARGHRLHDGRQPASLPPRGVRRRGGRGPDATPEERRRARRPQSRLRRALSGSPRQALPATSDHGRLPRLRRPGAPEQVLGDPEASSARRWALSRRGRRVREAPPDRGEGEGRPRNRPAGEAVPGVGARLCAALPEPGDPGVLAVSLISFGFKHGYPAALDLCFDVRFLANPHFDARLRARTGRDPEVARFIEAGDQTEPFYTRLKDFLAFCLPNYRRENRAYLT